MSQSTGFPQCPQSGSYGALRLLAPSTEMSRIAIYLPEPCKRTRRPAERKGEPVIIVMGLHFLSLTPISFL